MTADEFFKKFSAQESCLKVGSNIFFSIYEASAKAYSLRTGQPLERLTRPAKATRQEAANAETEAQASKNTTK